MNSGTDLSTQNQFNVWFYILDTLWYSEEYEIFVKYLSKVTMLSPHPRFSQCACELAFLIEWHLLVSDLCAKSDQPNEIANTDNDANDFLGMGLTPYKGNGLAVWVIPISLLKFLLSLEFCLDMEFPGLNFSFSAEGQVFLGEKGSSGRMMATCPWTCKCVFHVLVSICDLCMNYETFLCTSAVVGLLLNWSQSLPLKEDHCSHFAVSNCLSFLLLSLLPIRFGLLWYWWIDIMLLVLVSRGHPLQIMFAFFYFLRFKLLLLGRATRWH